MLHLAATTSDPRRFSRITNGIGFTVFAVWAAVTLSKIPAVGIMLAPTFLMELVVAISFLIRDEPKAATRSLRGRVSAYGGSFFAIAFLQLAQRSHPGAHSGRPMRCGISAMRSASNPLRAGW